MSPPFRFSLAEVGRMTDADLFGFFGLDRDDEGRPKPPRVECDMTDRDLHRVHMFFCGIHDPATVERLWRERGKK